MAMTVNMPAIYRPSYARRAPRWHDGAGRLLDIGSVFDLKLPPESDTDRLNEDLVMVRQDMRGAVEQLREAVDALERGKPQ